MWFILSCSGRFVAVGYRGKRSVMPSVGGKERCRVFSTQISSTFDTSGLSDERFARFASSPFPPGKQICPIRERGVMKMFVGTLHVASFLARTIDSNKKLTNRNFQKNCAEWRVSRETGRALGDREKVILDISQISNAPLSTNGTSTFFKDNSLRFLQEGLLRDRKWPTRQFTSKQVLQKLLFRAMEAGLCEDAIGVVEQMMALHLKLDLEMLTTVVNFLAARNIICAYDVLRRHQNAANSPMNIELYGLICDSVGLIDPHCVRPHLVAKMINRLRNDLNELGLLYQHSCYPRLVLGLIKQRFECLGETARSLYHHMMKCRFPLDARTLEEFLSHSKYSRQRDLPYHDVMRSLVSMGFYPYPPNAIHALENLFPFTDLRTTIIALAAVVDLQSSTESSEIYRVDIGTLEQISAAGARKSSLHLNFLVWDALEQLGYEPTEGIYENTIQTFCMSYRQDHNLFAVLAEMECKGFEPSRALIRSISRSLSELGDVDRTFAMFDEFVANGFKPTLDSFSFLFEALAVDMDPNRQLDDSCLKDVESRLDAAGSVVSVMEQHGLALCEHALHEYVQLLCNTGDVESALSYVSEALDSNQRVLSKTLLVLASACGNAGYVDGARYLASKIGEPWDFLFKRINRWAEAVREADEN